MKIQRRSKNYVRVDYCAFVLFAKLLDFLWVLRAFHELVVKAEKMVASRGLNFILSHGKLRNFCEVCRYGTGYNNHMVDADGTLTKAGVHSVVAYLTDVVEVTELKFVISRGRKAAEIVVTTTQATETSWESGLVPNHKLSGQQHVRESGRNQPSTSNGFRKRPTSPRQDERAGRIDFKRRDVAFHGAGERKK